MRSTTALDAVSQRKFACSVFVAVQAAKILLVADGTATLAQTCLLDVGFLALVRWWAIPRLTPSLPIAFVLAAVLFALNFTCIAYSSARMDSPPEVAVITGTSLMKPLASHGNQIYSKTMEVESLMKPLASHGNQIYSKTMDKGLSNSAMTRLSNGHSNGLINVPQVDNTQEEIDEGFSLPSFVVNVIVPDKIHMNPSGMKHCIHPKLKNKVHVHVMFYGGDGPWLIEYVKKTSDGIITSFSQILAKNAPLILKDLGLYQIVSVTDTLRNIPGQIVDSQINILSCPSVDWLDTAFLPKNLCSSKENTVTIPMLTFGPSPITVWYRRYLNGAVSENSISTSYSDMNQNTRESNIMKIISSLSESGSYTFEILRIKDKIGHNICFSQDNATKDCLMLESLSKVKFTAHLLPRASFDLQSMVLRSGLDTNSRIPITLTGNAPWNLTLILTDSNSSSQIYFDGINTPNTELMLAKPGTYNIERVQDKFCTSFDSSSGLNNSINVMHVLPPSMKLNFAVLEEKCQGSSGLSVDFAFTGTPPYKITYTVKHLDKSEESSHTFISDTQSGHLEFRPKSSGTYEYTFQSIQDYYFTSPIFVQGERFKQEIHPQSKVKFTRKNIIKCKNDDVTLDLIMSGIPPWSINYTIQQGNQLKHLTTEFTFDKTITITNLLPGDHVISIERIIDGNNCSWPVTDSETVTVHVRADRPTAVFSSNENVSHLLHERPIFDVLLTGTPPFKLKYKKVGESSPVSVVIDNVNGSFQVEASGEYEIVDIRDKYCSGIIGPHRILSAIPFLEPTLKLNLDHTLLTHSTNFFEKRSICQMLPSAEGQKESIQLKLSGQPPFSLQYEHRINDLFSTLFDVISDSNIYTLSFDTITPGSHEYHFVNISDSNYNISLLDKSIKIRQTVHENPVFVSLQSAPDNNFCLSSSDSDSTRKMDIVVKGRAPFEVSFDIEFESRVIHRIAQHSSEESFQVTLPPLFKSGIYTLKMTKLRDATGCHQLIASKEINLMQNAIHIYESVQLIPINVQKEACPGSLLTYSIQGNPPFDISLDFKPLHNELSREYKGIVSDSLLSIHCDIPGQFTAIRVCNNMGCCSTQGIDTIVRPMPEIVVEEGNYVAKEIILGEEATFNVKFKGTPPFSFSYKTIDAILGEGVIKVQDVKEFNYVIKTKRAGKSKIQNVKDRYCSAPRMRNQNARKANINVKM